MRRGERLASLERANGVGERVVHTPRPDHDHDLQWMKLRSSGQIPVVLRWPGIDSPEETAAIDAFMLAGRKLGYLNDAGEMIR